MKVFFWLTMLFVFYTYGGYPLLLALIARLSPCPVMKKNCMPFVSVVIAAGNEECNIKKRLENLLLQDYAADHYEIIVVSDGSTDRTNEIVSSFTDSNVQLIALPEKVGKAVALNQGIASAAGKIVVFADARQIFAADTVRQLVTNFADPTVGCVSGELMFVDNADCAIRVEMGAYWRYEKVIRRMESASGSVIGATGAVYAIRKDLYHPLPPGTILDDVLTPMTIALKGYRVVFDSAATAYDVLSKDIDQEWKRKVRTLAGNWQLLGFAPTLLIPRQCQLWWRFMSHKVFRLLVPFSLPCMLTASLALDGIMYHAVLIAQLTVYLMAITGAVIPALRKNRLVNVTYFFVVMNLAVVVGFWHWLSGRCTLSWQPAYLKQN